LARTERDYMRKIAVVFFLIFLANVLLVDHALASGKKSYGKAYGVEVKRTQHLLNGVPVKPEEITTRWTEVDLPPPKIVTRTKYVPVAVPAETMGYTIPPGKSLDGIAQSFKTERKVLLALNPKIKDPNRIKAGWIIKVPVPYAQTRAGQWEREAAEFKEMLNEAEKKVTDAKTAAQTFEGEKDAAEKKLAEVEKELLERKSSLGNFFGINAGILIFVLGVAVIILLGYAIIMTLVLIATRRDLRSIRSSFTAAGATP